MDLANQNITLEDSKHNAALAWESFVESGEFSLTPPREVISNSWKKSYSLGVDPKAERAPVLMTAEEIAEQIQVDDLAKSAIPRFEKLSGSLRDSQHVAVLADANGSIFYSGGHEWVRDKLEDINFKPGAVWSEDEVGSNGIGTPLALGRPEMVLGDEHYCQGWQSFVCYGAPIKDPFSHKTIGVIDISTLSYNMRREVMTTVISFAESVQAHLFQRYLFKRDQLRLLAKSQVAKNSKDPLLLFDTQGMLVDFNEAAVNVLGIDPIKAIELSIYKTYPQFIEPFERCLKNYSHEEVRMSVFNLEEKCRVILEPVKHSTHNLGVILRIISNSQLVTSYQGDAEKEPSHSESVSMKMASLLNSFNDADKEFNLKEINDEIIKFAVEQCNGNISRAATMLGINRTTIYRHLKDKYTEE